LRAGRHSAACAPAGAQLGGRLGLAPVNQSTRHDMQ
jgi:hypothetical protein